MSDLAYIKNMDIYVRYVPKTDTYWDNPIWIVQDTEDGNGNKCIFNANSFNLHSAIKSFFIFKRRE